MNILKQKRIIDVPKSGLVSGRTDPFVDMELR